MAITRRKFIIGGSVVAVAAGAGILTPMLTREGRFVPGKPRFGFVEGTEGALPQQSDVVVIGAGILGVMTAINLAERGLSVVIVEKGNIAGEQSSRFYGQAITYKMPDETFLLHHLGKHRWREMNAKVGVDTTYRTQGRVEVPLDEEDLVHVRSWIDERSKNVGSDIPFKTRIIEGSELNQRLRGAKSDWKIAGFEEDSGSFDAEVTAFVMAEYAKKIGIKIYTNCAARGLETHAGVISDVVTEKGAIKTSQVVVAGGVWSRLFMQNLGVDVPTLPAYQSQQLISAAPNAPGGNVALPGNIFFREQADGTYATSPRVIVAPVVKESFTYGYKYLPLLAMPDFPVHISLNEQLINSFTQDTSWKLDEVSPFEKNRDMTALPDLPELNASLEKLKTEFPAFKDSKLVDQWSGAMAIAPDENPIISEVKEYPGLVINTATGWGMTESPVSAEITADLLLGKEPVINAKPFSLYRF
ncbi:TPA: FAD-dependent oxidoreductase [Providencia alcalifaciens]|uniref:FAD-dependent oxidoreductase n=2 Tax=Providencia alcalifaciens TaxID=126385 RepID=A0AAW9V9E7_9GAMM|nr:MULTISPECIES: FAD-dependent oxidoreductase [Providencia]ATG17924.1 FAD-dependent oxidoreductase [Providencia alcalifaciens]EEB47200.1 Tat pathway signal sequence domain protein [Providencia alcalifaciens DSM 30120]EKT66496.1 exported amino acid deaminase [Providencia alcalifaciens Dmel2]ETT03583.1 FAD dependent oxidoreductase [Providencia alcalifaciens F90-2004]EUC95266.1 FAD dependent oxidoreductase [Providencia alcalifaciens PAL-2]